MPGDADVQGIRRLIDGLTGKSRVTATAIQTVGAEGYDGLLVARVEGRRLAREMKVEQACIAETRIGWWTKF